MAEVVDELLVKLGLETDAKGFREANNQFAGLRTGALALGTVAIAAGVGLAKMSDGVARSVDTLGKWSNAAGVSIRKAQQLAFALQQAGSANPEADMMAMFANVEDMQRRARRGQLSEWELIESGLNLHSIANMSKEDGLDFLMRGVSDMPDPARQRRALDEMGFSGVGQQGVMTNYAGTIANFRRSDELGNADDELFKKAEAYTNAMGELSKSMDGFRQMVGSQMLPGMTRLVEGITGWSVENRSEIEEAFKEAMPFLKATATGIGVLVAAQVGTKGIAMLAAAATTSGPAAAVLGLGAFYMDEDNRRDGLDSFTGSLNHYKRWLLRQMGVEQSDDPIPEGWIHVPEFNENTPARPGSPRVLPRSTDRTPSTPMPSGLTPDELSYRPSASELIAPGTHADFTEGNRRLMRGYYPGAYAPPPSTSNPQASAGPTNYYSIDARGSTDPAATEAAVRRVVDERIANAVQVSRDGIPNNVA